MVLISKLIKNKLNFQCEYFFMNWFYNTPVIAELDITHKRIIKTNKKGIFNIWNDEFGRPTSTISDLSPGLRKINIFEVAIPEIIVVEKVLKRMVMTKKLILV